MTHATEEMAPELAAEAADARPAPAGGSTLIEFPGARSIPQWRKDLSERVREIQKRKAREAAPDAEEAAGLPAEEPPGVSVAEDAQTKEGPAAQTKEGSAASRLGLVPPLPDAPELNPLVAAALKRIERARQQQPAAHRAAPGGGRAAATAVARVAEEQYEPKAERRGEAQLEARAEAQQSPAAEVNSSPELKQTTAEAARPAGLVVVPPQKTSADVVPAPKSDAPEAKAAPVETSSQVAAPPEAAAARAPEKPPAQVEPETVRQDRPAPRRVADGVIDDAWLSRLEERILPPVQAAARTADDIAPLAPRLLAALIDLLLVVFLSSPFAAIVELTNGNWADPRVAASMGGVAVVLMFLYLTVSTALAGRTWGMSLFKLHTVDAETALAPTTGQCVRRTILYILSLAAFGLGILYALFDRERRAAHDHLSGTVVVRH